MAIQPGTELHRRLGFDRGRHASVGSWPRLGHMLEHVDGVSVRRYAITSYELRGILPLLLEPHSVEEISAIMGPEWTPRQIEARAARISAMFGLAGGFLAHRRLELAGIAAGARPCFCEA